MATTSLDTDLAPDPAFTPARRRAYRTAAISASIAAASLIVTPAVVLISNFVIGAEAAYEPAHFRDPVTWMNAGGLAALYGISFAVVGISAAFLVGAIARALPGRTSPVSQIAGTVIVTGWLISSASAAAFYSTNILGTITQVTDDPAVRAMVGYADALATQGVLGAANLGLALWLVLVAIESRRAGAVGMALLVVAWALGIALAAAVAFGLGGAASVLAIVPFTGCAIVFFRLAKGRGSRHPSVS